MANTKVNGGPKEVKKYTAEWKDADRNNSRTTGCTDKAKSYALGIKLEEESRRG